MAHTTSLTQANDDEIIELTDIVEKGTVPQGSGLVSSQDSQSLLESQMSDLLSDDASDVNGIDELDLDSLLGDSPEPDDLFPQDSFDDDPDSPDSAITGLSSSVAMPEHNLAAAKPQISADIDFDSLLQEMVDAKTEPQGFAEPENLELSSATSAQMSSGKSVDTTDDADFLGELDDVDNLLRGLVPPGQPSEPLPSATASLASADDEEEHDLAALLAGLDKTTTKSGHTQAHAEVDDLDALLDSIMNPSEVDRGEEKNGAYRLASPIEVEMSEISGDNIADNSRDTSAETSAEALVGALAGETELSAGFDDLDSLLSAALQPAPVTPPATPVPATAKPLVAAEPDDQPDFSNFDSELDALLAQSAAEANLTSPEVAPAEAQDDFIDLEALLQDAAQTLPPPSAKTSGTGDDFDLDALLSTMQKSSSENAPKSELPSPSTALLENDIFLPENDVVDSLDDFDTELDSIFAPPTSQVTDDAVATKESASEEASDSHDSFADFDLDAFLSDLGPLENAEETKDSSAQSEDESDLAPEQEEQLDDQDHRVQELALAALSEALGDDEHAFTLDIPSEIDSRESNASAQAKLDHDGLSGDFQGDMLSEQTHSKEHFVSGVFFEEPSDFAAVSEKRMAEGQDDFSDMSFEELPLDNDLGDPLLIDETSAQAELGAVVLQGLEQLATDILSIQEQMNKLSTPESQQGLLLALQENFAQIQEDVQQLSERQAMSLAAVEARISDLEAQFSEEFAVHSGSTKESLTEQLAPVVTRVAALEARPAALAYDDAETLRKLDHLSGIMVALESRLHDVEASQADKADMTQDVARLVDRVEALELSRHRSPDSEEDLPHVSALEDRVKALESNTEKAVAETAARVIREEIAALLSDLS